MKDVLSGAGTSRVPSKDNSTTFAVTAITPEAIMVAFNTLPGNQPQAYENFIAVYNGTPDFPFDSSRPPIARMEIPTNVSSGDLCIPMDVLINNPYVLGYGVGHMLSAPAQPFGNVCATIYLPPTGEAGISTNPSISVVDAGYSSILCSYRLPAGINPSMNGAWAGLWMNNQPAYTVPPAMAVPLASGASAGSVMFNNAQLRRGAMYSVGLFMSGWNNTAGTGTLTTMAATAQFTT